jgi:hypothetical protein
MPNEAPKFPYDLSRVSVLSFVNHGNFGEKIAGAGNRHLLEYHETTRNRLEIAEYCMKLLLHNYDDDIAFVAGLTGFLVQAKAALNSLCQEINLYCELNIGKKHEYAMDTEELTEPHNLLALSRRNLRLSQFVVQQLGSSNPWFATFRILHDSEGIHRQHAPKLIPLGVAPHDVQVGDMKLAEFCVESLSRINKIAEASYDLMTNAC